VLRADGRRVWPSFRFSYQWMRRQMDRRLGRAPSHVTYPIWSWLQYDSAAASKPDLRCSAHLQAGTPGVRVEFEAEEQDVFLSDFDLWHYVLNSCYLPASAQERDRRSKRAIEESWEHIFDLDFAPRNVAVRRGRKSIQGVTWHRSVSTRCGRYDDSSRVGGRRIDREADCLFSGSNLRCDRRGLASRRPYLPMFDQCSMPAIPFHL